MTVSYTSTVPAAVAGLVAALGTWPGLEGTEVHDGPKVTSSKALEVIAVGWTGERMARTGAYPDPVGPEADVTVTVDGLSLTRVHEQYPVRCLIAVRNGAKDVTAATGRAYQLLSQCGAAVAADKTLGGAVAMASLGSHQVTRDQDQRGAEATIVFEVNCDAWTAG